MKKRLALLTLASIMLTSSVPVYASGGTSTTMNATSSFTSELAPTDLSQIVVSIPDNMDLALNNDKTKFVSSGNVSAKGTLKDGYQLSVSTNESATYKCTGKPDVAGTVTFGTQTWSSAQLEASKITLDSRAVSVEVANSDDLAAGTYTTNILFNIGVSEAHVHTAGSPVTENYRDSTCSEEGSYDSVVYCTECGDEMSRTARTVYTKPHTPDYTKTGETLACHNLDTDYIVNGTEYYDVECSICGETWEEENSGCVTPDDMDDFDVNIFKNGYEEYYISGRTFGKSVTYDELTTSGTDLDYHLKKVVTNGVRSYKITALGSFAFYGCDGLKKLTIPNTVETINEGAFCNCTNLTDITIPNSVYSVEATYVDMDGGTYEDNGLFTGCTSLQTINYKGTKNRFKNLFPADCFHYTYYDDSGSEITGCLDNITIKCSDGTMTFSGGAYSE